ncbi:TerC/Alx family metal homeostasis membrane protein [Alloacidobacterium dinghuense]|uniref:TerC/Alx family metal homeostasis membrane protein n=1 Tax=Alloacidobacterium dinghuense TaxID=2763107 RepID=A0A7G8BHV8_9BACT|nr:TerC/Alx family metal homeostasis membrane protein [Alloacidobacterium dinghuense]QNI32128.1 TerC/Alx family metal homeostasis membrane protein [Alloacidobacterium dinghuense]
MIGGASISYWVGFHILVAVLLIVDLVLLQGGTHSARLRKAWAWTIFLATLACGFALFLSKTQGREPGLEFFSGYLIEASLSVDNLFVFLLMFRSLRLDADEQRRVLLWGVLGAIVMRATFIAVGVSLLNRFAWIEYVFGTFLLVAAIRLLRHKPGGESKPGMMSWLQRRCLRGVKDQGESGVKLGMPALLFVILAVEATDLVFALDSIPAVLAITRDPFIVYTSNIFAILGLRSLYFVLAGMLDKLRLLHYGLAVILAFVALKMLLVYWVEVPVTISLAFILTVLLIFAIASKLIPEKKHS